MIVSKRAMEDMGVEEFRNTPVGTGPFVFTSWTRGSEIVLDRFDSYWNDPYPYLDGVVFKVIPEEQARLIALKSGDIDIMDSVTPDNAPLIEADANLTLLEAPGLNVGYVAMNQLIEPFDDVLVRLAVNHAIDKQLLVDTFYKGRGEPAINPMPSNLWGWNDEIVDYEYNPDLARAYLAAAGYPNGFDTELWYMPVFRDYFPQPKLLAQAMQLPAIVVDTTERDRTFTGWDLPNYEAIESRAPSRGQLDRGAQPVGP
jgi:peptide/nickel transport system substrate-binding protein